MTVRILSDERMDVTESVKNSYLVRFIEGINKPGGYRGWKEFQSALTERITKIETLVEHGEMDQANEEALYLGRSLEQSANIFEHEHGVPLDRGWIYALQAMEEPQEWGEPFIVGSVSQWMEATLLRVFRKGFIRVRQKSQG
jgi:hypothetical protein